MSPYCPGMEGIKNMTFSKIKAGEFYHGLKSSTDCNFPDVRVFLQVLWHDYIDMEGKPDKERFKAGVINVLDELKNSYINWSEWSAMENLASHRSVMKYLEKYGSDIYMFAKEVAIPGDCENMREALSDLCTAHLQAAYEIQYRRLIGRIELGLEKL